MPPPLVVVMGVAGSGKSTIGPRLAERLGVEFVDGDTEHDAAAKAQMAAGIPLTEAERDPWLDRLHDVLDDRADAGVVLAASALTPAARQRLAGSLPVRFVALVAPADVLETRLVTRRGHYAGPELLPSQLDTLALDDRVATVDATQPVDQVVDAAAEAVGE